MTMLEKRVEALEQAAGLSDAHRVLILRNESDEVPSGFTGKVIRLVFVAPKVDIEVPHGNT